MAEVKTMSDNSAAKKLFKRKKKVCPLCDLVTVENDSIVDYKNPKLLSKFISERGRMLPPRITSVCKKHQAQLKKSIKIARILALLSFTNF